MLNKNLIENAISQAELRTSGEIRVFVEEKVKGEILDRAAHVFEKLEMHETDLRNGVLFYLALSEQKFAILGDVGINIKVEVGFWDHIKTEMLVLFKQNKPSEALEKGILMAGEALSKHFPYDDDTDINELSNEIVFG